MKEFVLL